MPFDSSPEIYNRRVFSGELSEVTSFVSKINLWLDEMQSVLHTMKELPENWDSYGSPKITDIAVKNVADLLVATAKLGMPKPYIFPVSGGGLQLEWQSGSRELEIEILPNGEIAYLKVYANGEMEEGIIPKVNIWKLTSWFKTYAQQTEPITMSL